MTPSSYRAQPVLPPGLSLYPGLLSLCDIQLWSPLLAVLYCAASCFVVRASVVTRAGRAALLPCQHDLHSLWWLLWAPLLPHCTHMGPEASQGKRESCKTYHLDLIHVWMDVFIYLRCSNWVPLGSRNVTKSGQCFHGAEGMLVKLRSSSACMEILDLEWIEVGKSIWAWK